MVMVLQFRHAQLHDRILNISSIVKRIIQLIVSLHEYSKDSTDNIDRESKQKLQKTTKSWRETGTSECQTPVMHLAMLPMRRVSMV